MPEYENTATHSVGIPTLRDDDRRLTPSEVSEITGLSITTLRDYRSKRGLRYGPPFVKDGRKVFYKLAEVLTWMDGRITHHGGHCNG